MSTSTSTASALTGFPKYPELPPELRLKIIKEALDSNLPLKSYYRAKDGPKISQYACIDREWNRVVELRLFKEIELRRRTGDPTWATETVPQELVDFGAICGKRSSRLSRVLLTIDSDLITCVNQTYQHTVLRTILRLFDLMKDWSHQNREQSGLIELILTFDDEREEPLQRLAHPSYLGKVPQVPVIGSIHEPEPEDYILHPCTFASLCQKLPSAHHTSLTLPAVPSEYISIQDITNALDTLRVQKPGMKHLDLWFACCGLLDPWVWDDSTRSQTLLPILQCLNASPSPWSDRLESLEIHYSIAVQDFLRGASHTIWPNLKRIKLVGLVYIPLVNKWYMDEEDANAVADENGSSVIKALILALPNMPKLTRVQIKLFFNAVYIPKAFEASIHLGNIARTEKASSLQHCGDKFVPNSDNGVARVGGIYLPGELAARLQDAVRLHRRQELEVFTCTENGYYYHRKPHRPCAVWNRRTESWDPIFTNDLDIFMYEMGQYWEEYLRHQR